VVADDPGRRAGRRRLLVIGAGPAQLGLLAAARKRDLFVIAVDRDPSAPGFRYADRRAIVSTEDEHGIERLASAERVDGIVAPGIDWPVAIAARTAERLGLPHAISAASAALTVSKRRQRERLGELGVPQPATVVCASADDAVAAGGRLGWPCVVKAPDRQGQRGLAVVAGPEEMGAAAKEALAASRSGQCLVEELVTGREITVNAFSLRGRFHPLTITDRVTAPPPAFGVALAHVWPSDLEPAQLGAAVEAARAAAEALGIADGPTYTQVLVGDAGPRVGEVAARVGGGHDAELCRAALGVDLNGLTIAAALGQEIRPQELAPAGQVGGAVVRFLVAPPGELRDAHGMDDAYALEGVRGIRLYRRRGHEFGEFRRGADRAGAILAVGDSREDALERAERAAALIRFETSGSRALV
jgi:biotin carboxylase